LTNRRFRVYLDQIKNHEEVFKMKLRKHTDYSLEIDEETFPLPFDPEGDPAHVYVAANGLKAVLAFLVQDECGEDPFEISEDGDFYQFDRSYKHATPRPDFEEFKRTVRANPGRVVTVDGGSPDYSAGVLLTAKDCRPGKRAGGRTIIDGYESEAERVLDGCLGYYIVPEDVTDAYSYAHGALKTYSQWCNGEVYGVVVWIYERRSIAEPWTEPGRDECWGYHGYDGYTAEELERIFIEQSTPDEEHTRC